MRNWKISCQHATDGILDAKIAANRKRKSDETGGKQWSSSLPPARPRCLCRSTHQLDTLISRHASRLSLRSRRLVLARQRDSPALPKSHRGRVFRLVVHATHLSTPPLADKQIAANSQ